MGTDTVTNPDHTPASGGQPVADTDKALVKLTATTFGVLGSVYADSTITSEDDREAKAKYVMDLLKTARDDSVPAQGASAPTPTKPDGSAPQAKQGKQVPQEKQQPPDAADPDAIRDAELQLNAMYRASEVPGLDTAAKALTGVTTALTALFAAVGFSTGDFDRVIRDDWLLGLAFIGLAGVALVLGTFAVCINAYLSDINLHLERLALRAGIVCAVAAFTFAAWGLSKGASAAQTSPTISASFDTTGKSPVLKVTASSSAVPQSSVLAATVWGEQPGSSSWNILTYVVAGPDHDGDATVNISVNNVSPYTYVVAQAGLAPKGAAIPSAPSLSWAQGDATLSGNCPADDACATLAVPST